MIFHFIIDNILKEETGLPIWEKPVFWVVLNGNGGLYDYRGKPILPGNRVLE